MAEANRAAARKAKGSKSIVLYYDKLDLLEYAVNSGDITEAEGFEIIMAIKEYSRSSKEAIRKKETERREPDISAWRPGARMYYMQFKFAEDENLETYEGQVEGAAGARSGRAADRDPGSSQERQPEGDRPGRAQSWARGQQRAADRDPGSSRRGPEGSRGQQGAADRDPGEAAVNYGELSREVMAVCDVWKKMKRIPDDDFQEQLAAIREEGEYRGKPLDAEEVKHRLFNGERR